MQKPTDVSMLRILAATFGSIMLSVTVAATAATAGDVTIKRLVSADQEPANWFTLGRDSAQSYFSPLDSINAKTVGRLGFAWSYDLGTKRGQEATPIVVDGVMYASGYIGNVYAIDAVTGLEKWRFDPTIVARTMRNPCCDVINRGVAVWQGRVYVASIDGQLYALDAATGKQIWAMDTIIDHSQSYSSSGAPLIAGNVVVLGNSGGDMDTVGVRGYVSAYDLKSGAFQWRFFTVPPPPGQKFEHPELALAAKSWDPARNNPKSSGGATVWDGMTYDPVLNLLYFGTGNPAPSRPRKVSDRSTDELFSCSILALHPDTGRMAWYYQTTPGDQWDFDSTQKLVLADIKISGRLQHVLMQANKNGFFYILDRGTGRVLSAKNFTFVNWASGVDLKTGRPMIQPQAEFYKKPSNVYPSSAGAHSWQPMSFDPVTGLVYIPVADASNVLINMPANGGQLKHAAAASGTGGIVPDDSYDPASVKDLFGPLPGLESIQAEHPGKLVRELIRAWDPVKQSTAWEHETSSGTRSYDGGIMSTAGNLVFQGHKTGELVVYAADTGVVLKTLQTGSHIMAAPITYAVNGVQYVAVQAGYGGAAIAGVIPPESAALKYDNENRILVFKLDGGTVPLPALLKATPFPAPPPSTATAAELNRGELKFTEQCGRCHAFGPNITPDLRKLSPGMHAAFNDIVLKGTFASVGMESFADILDEHDVDAIHAFLIDQQRSAYADQQNGK
jgi:quinohemoprotein ethanol dehydrogenase